MAGRTFRLYGFSDGTRVVITRGENEEQAMSYASHSRNFPRGVTIYPIAVLPINAAELYSGNHAPGWLHRRPRWLERQEVNQAIKLGYQGVLERIKNNVPMEILMYQPD